MTGLFYLMLTFCPPDVVVPNARCQSVEVRQDIVACSASLPAPQPGWRLVGIMAAEDRR